ncbi:MAG: hypothetical protein QGH93_09595 [Gammaproteobacteria bacterium]|jgi:hypothetical protein|nr:hypothetical protein [Gammaproteobacteria bacterium]
MIEVDTGAGLFAGNGVGAAFSGTYTYGVTAADIDSVEPDASVRN